MRMSHSAHMNESWHTYEGGMGYNGCNQHREQLFVIQPIADRVAQNLEIISRTFSTNQNSAHGIYDEYQVIDDKSHENPGTPGNILKVFRNNLKILCHPICNWLNLCLCGQTVESL